MVREIGIQPLAILFVGDYMGLYVSRSFKVTSGKFYGGLWVA